MSDKTLSNLQSSTTRIENIKYEIAQETGLNPNRKKINEIKDISANLQK